MPFIRQTRDKRGFEQTLVMHTYHPGGSMSGRARVLYLFRTPANLKVGRRALEPEVMEALEHTHPDLSFDWNALTRDPAAARVEQPAERPPRRPPSQRSSEERRERQQQAQVRRPEPPREVQPEAGPPPVDDGSVLVRTVGVHEAARLRRRYSELMQRISRRSRSPEERDRLFERARRLNPDDWPDEASIRAEAPVVDAAWNAIAFELPSRRRGRRGGRRRPEGDQTSSAIMDHGDGGETREQEASAATEPAHIDRADHGGDVGDALGPDHPETGSDPDVPVGD